jgi:hypothetical protein
MPKLLSGILPSGILLFDIVMNAKQFFFAKCRGAKTSLFCLKTFDRKKRLLSKLKFNFFCLEKILGKTGSC